MSTLTKVTTHRAEIPGTDITFEVSEPLPDIYTDVYVKELEGDADGDAYAVSWLIHDDDAQDSWEWEGGGTNPAEWVNGCFRDFRTSQDGGGEEARDEFMAQMIEAVGEDHVFIVDVYSHGLDHFSVANTMPYPDRQWDVAPACILAVPPDVTDPRAWADGVLESYTSWANGDVWGVATHYVKTDGTVSSSQSVWGIIGHEYAEECAKDGGY